MNTQSKLQLEIAPAHTFNLSTYLQSALGLSDTTGLSICGIDEVGRGAFAGPLVAGAVVFPPGFHHPAIKDSKQLSPKAREAAVALIHTSALSVAVVEISASEIDAHGVGAANLRAFYQLMDTVAADIYCCDGTLKLNTTRRYVSLPKADQLVPAVAAASIVAKVYRDTLMRTLSADVPEYGWQQNKGYGSSLHCAALREFGMHQEHRRSFIHFQTGERASDKSSS